MAEEEWIEFDEEDLEELEDFEWEELDEDLVDEDEYFYGDDEEFEEE